MHKFDMELNDLRPPELGVSKTSMKKMKSMHSENVGKFWF
jgi:hypothetical protein